MLLVLLVQLHLAALLVLLAVVVLVLLLDKRVELEAIDPIA